MEESGCGEESKKETKDELVGNITCPKCGHVQPMTIPTNSCQAFYKCEGCEEMIAAKESCCIFCDYGDRPCPVAAQHAA